MSKRIIRTHELSGNDREVFEELVMLESDEHEGFVIARRDWRKNQWTNPQRSATESRAASLDAGWRTGRWGRTRAQTTALWHRLTEEDNDCGLWAALVAVPASGVVDVSATYTDAFNEECKGCEW